MFFSFFRFVVASILVTAIYSLSVIFLKDKAYFIVTVPFIVLYLFKRIDALICYNVLIRNADSKLAIRTSRMHVLTYVSEYNLSGLSYVKIPNNIEYVGIPNLIWILSLNWPQSATGNFFLRKMVSFKYDDNLYIDSFGNPSSTKD